MIPLSFYVGLFFVLTAFATLLLFYRAIKKATMEAASKKANAILLALLLWLMLQAVISANRVYYANPQALPPKILLFGLFPAMLTIVLLFVTAGGKKFVDSLPLAPLTYLHIVRVPVEIVLFWLYLEKAVPQLMTFEGRNFDIIAGITAPFVAYFGLQKNKLNRTVIIAWNVIALALLLNIVINALLSTPSPFQMFAKDQPNRAVLYFPYSWLPTFIVPVVLFSHLVSLRQLLQKKAIPFSSNHAPSHGVQVHLKKNITG